jgi:hypothetical protein
MKPIFLLLLRASALSTRNGATQRSFAETRNIHSFLPVSHSMTRVPAEITPIHGWPISLSTVRMASAFGVR